MDVQPIEQKDLHQQDEDWKHDLRVQMRIPQSEPEICQPTKCMKTRRFVHQQKDGIHAID